MREPVAPGRGSGQRDTGNASTRSSRLVSRCGRCLRLPLAAHCARTRRRRADTMAFYKALDLEAAGKYREAVPLFRIGAAHVGRRQRAARTRARVRGARLVRLARRAARYADRGEPARGDVPHRPASDAAVGRPRRRAATRVRRVDSRHAERARRRIASTRGCCCRKTASAAADSVLARARQSARHDEGSSIRACASARGAGAVDRVGASVAAGAAHGRLSGAGRGVRARADALVDARRRFARSSSRCPSKCRRGARSPSSR